MSIKIAIDCGHGSNTAGKRTAPFTENVDINGDGIIDIKKNEQYREHYANVMVATYLEKELIRCGFEIFKTGWDDSNSKDDVDTNLSKRQVDIKNARCDYSVSIHFNAHGDGKIYTSAEGIETLIHSTNAYAGDSRKLAEKIQSYLIQGTKQKSRSVKTSKLAMCNCYRMGTTASVLVELGFMTNKNEAQKMMANSAFCKECAIEICKGFCDYLGKTYVSEEDLKENVKAFRVRVTAKILNIRKSNSVLSKVVGTIKKGEVYTIVEVHGNWYKLLSGIGWINKNYVEKM